MAWRNQDLGILTCFFDGLSTYLKTWLQFLFPLYILAMVAVMIIASNHSTRVTRLIRTNAVTVLVEQAWGPHTPPPSLGAFSKNYSSSWPDPLVRNGEGLVSSRTSSCDKGMQ